MLELSMLSLLFNRIVTKSATAILKLVGQIKIIVLHTVNAENF